MRILISDDLSSEAKSILERIPGAQVDVKVGLKPSELREIIGGYEALAVRSATKVTKEILEAAGKLRVIGRAGTGVDNIDLAAATRRGVVVMNAPGGNSVSVAEHTVALLLALARQVADASNSTRAGMRALGLQLYSKAPSAAMTTVLAPEGIDSEKLVKHLFKEYGIKLVGGQDAAKGRIFRIAHLGYFDDFDMLIVVGAVERGLKDLGAKVQLGAGLAAAQAAMAEAAGSTGQELKGT